jgi:hypothetical protein
MPARSQIAGLREVAAHVLPRQEEETVHALRVLHRMLNE